MTPDIVRDTISTTDSSTPPQYDPSSGWLLAQLTDHSGILTQNGRERYNALVGAYQLQFADTYHVFLRRDSGVFPWVDQYGNELFKIDGEHLEYFARLARWAKSGKPNDTLWQKLKASI